MFQTEFAEEIETHFVFKKYFSAIYEIMWKNILERG